MTRQATMRAPEPTVGGAPVLSDEQLERFRGRAPGYDRENRFFEEDFEELRDAGYLLLPVPEELGGRGMRLAEVGAEQRRLGRHAPATALAVNMHLYWMGCAADLWRAGDDSLEWILREAVAGHVFAAGHAESGNDVPVLYSTTRANRVDGGYSFVGRKSFGSLGPVWTYLGLHGTDHSDPENPRIVHAFMPRDTPGSETKRTWDDVLGMRATRSDDTILNDAFVPDQYVSRIVPTGFAGMDPFVVSAFAWALLGYSNVYLGLAESLFETVVERVKAKTSIALARPSMAYHAGVQREVADMWLDMEAAGALLDRTAREYTDGVDHGPLWGPKLVSAKFHAVEAAWRVADRALEIVGGFGIFPASGIERMVRDARLGRIHPTNALLTREIVGKAMLGVDLDEQPR
jgi:alkylation response protein AidB-like acyl-CoA dehydrogenase